MKVLDLGGWIEYKIVLGRKNLSRLLDIECEWSQSEVNVSTITYITVTDHTRGLKISLGVSG